MNEPVHTPVQHPKPESTDLQERSSRARPIAPAKRAKRRFDGKAQTAFCELTAAGMSCAAACRELGYSRDTPYAVAKQDEAFAAAWNEARETGADYLEDVAYKLASEGGEDVEYDGDGNVRRRTKRAPNPAILARVLAAWRPERWGDKPQVALGFQVNTVRHEQGLTLADLGDVLGRAKGLDLSGFLGVAKEISSAAKPLSESDALEVTAAARRFEARVHAAGAEQQRALPAGEGAHDDEAAS
jgi:hypothetical protein